MNTWRTTASRHLAITLAVLALASVGGCDPPVQSKLHSPAKALPVSKGANMLICYPLASADAVTPQMVDAAFLHDDGSGDDPIGRMATVYQNCLRRSAYLIAKTNEPNLSKLANEAVSQCSIVHDHYAEISKHQSGLDVDFEPIEATGSNENRWRREEDLIRQARIGDCWLQ